MPGVLEGRDVTVVARGATILDGVTVEVGEWEIVGLFGPAGSGKTTVLDVLTGAMDPPASGVIRLRGADVTGFASSRLARLGIARTWERPGMFPTLTVMQSILTAQHLHAGYATVAGMLGGPASFSEEAELRRNGEEILDYLGMLPVADRVVERLPEPARRMCDLAMALAMDPDVVLLDEPTGGMSAQERSRFGRILAYLRDSLNLTVLVASREPAGLLDVCDFAYVIEAGRVVGSGERAAIRSGRVLAAAYGGERGAA
jgi:branched-chain amino acid transport system ATP-binding protein